MVVNEPGTITVSYILNIPEASMKAVPWRTAILTVSPWATLGRWVRCVNSLEILHGGLPPSQDASDHQDYEMFSGDPLRTKPSSITRILGGGDTHHILQLQIDKNHFMAVEESANPSYE